MVLDVTLKQLRDDLDPTVREFINTTNAAYASHREGRGASITEAREIAELVRAPWVAGGPAMARTETHMVDTPHGPVRIRLYDPTPEANKPVLLYVHGGGWVMFSLDTHDRIMREYAARAGVCVIGIDYALSPEAKFPVALEQIVAVVRHVRDQAAAYGVDSQRLALGGDSAGGNMALAASIILREAGEGAALKALVLNYGAFAFDMSAEDKTRYGGEDYMLTADEMLYFWDQYLADPGDRRNALAAPLLAELHELPPVFLCIPQCDVLHGQSLALNTRLQTAGNAVKAIIYAGASHSFLEAVSTSPLAGRAFDDAAKWLCDHL